jgi:hypothetical protein
MAKEIVMTMARVSFRDFLRGSIPADVLQLWDKKSNKSKGLYVSSEYANEVLAMINDAQKKRRQKRTEEIMAFAGAFGKIDDPDRSHRAIKASKYE